MFATKIRMRPSGRFSNRLLEIDQIFVIGCAEPGWYSKEILYGYLKENPGAIQVAIAPYPYLIPCKSPHGEKYVKSKANAYGTDNLLQLPRE